MTIKARSKRGKRRGATGKTATRNAKGRFTKGNPGGPGRGNRRGSALAAQTGTPRAVAAEEPIAHEELLARAERELDRLRSELADERAASATQSREWSLALHALDAFPAARAAVLAALWPAEEAERATEASGPAAGASVARPGGEPAVPADPGVPLPGEKREEPTVYDGASRVPVPPNFGGVIETGRPRRRGAGGIGDRYGDSGPLDSRD